MLLADVKMPGVNGVSLARCMRCDEPGLPIVFVTGYVGEVLQEVRDNSRYDEVLPKPFQLNELVEVVDRALSYQRVTRCLRRDRRGQRPLAACGA